MSSEAYSPPARVLASWKEIAKYFDREVRTVQRWEKEEGLPVHRHRHQRQSSVYAYPEELAAWWRERGMQLAEAPAEPAVPPATPAAANHRVFWATGAATLVLLVVALGWGVSKSRATEPAPPFRAVLFEVGTPNARLFNPHAVDVNGDGFDDIVVSAWQSHETYVLFGRAPGSGGGSLPSVANVVIRWTGSGQFGAMQAGDFNGDGIDDVMFSQFLEDPESFTATGKSFILWGRSRWPDTMKLPDDADVTLELNWPTDARMGSCTPERAGDLNGDGIEDVILSAPEYGFGDRKSSGAIFALWGRKKWPSRVEVSAAANLTLQGARTGEGLWGCSLGDLDGDGKSDLVAYANEGTLWNMLGGRGRHHIFYGRDEWPKVLDAASSAEFAVAGSQPNASAMTLLADVNGDKKDDLVVGRLLDFRSSPKSPDQVQIWFGGTRRQGTLQDVSADVTIRSPENGMVFGGALAAQDIDGDGVDDLIIAEQQRAGLYLVYGRGEWKTSGRLADYSPVVLFRDEKPAASYKLALGDFDADGLKEIAFTTPPDGPALPEGLGRMWVLRPYITLPVDVRPEQTNNVVLWPGVCVVRVPSEVSGPQKSQIDPATLRLAGAPATQWVVKENEGTAPQLQANFNTSAMQINLFTKQVSLTARTRTGLPAGGVDTITVVPTASPTGEKGAGGNSGANP